MKSQSWYWYYKFQYSTPEEALRMAQEAKSGAETLEVFIGSPPTHHASFEEPDFFDYRCPDCGALKQVEEEYDAFQKMWFPVSFKNTDCVCGCTMDMVYEK